VGAVDGSVVVVVVFVETITKGGAVVVDDLTLKVMGSVDGAFVAGLVDGDVVFGATARAVVGVGVVDTMIKAETVVGDPTLKVVGAVVDWIVVPGAVEGSLVVGVVEGVMVVCVVEGDVVFGDEAREVFVVADAVEGVVVVVVLDTITNAGTVVVGDPTVKNVGAVDGAFVAGLVDGVVVAGAVEGSSDGGVVVCVVEGEVVFGAEAGAVVVGVATEGAVVVGVVERTRAEEGMLGGMSVDGAFVAGSVDG
jgi:hypothetical protein